MAFKNTPKGLSKKTCQKIVTTFVTFKKGKRSQKAAFSGGYPRHLPKKTIRLGQVSLESLMVNQDQNDEEKDQGP